MIRLATKFPVVTQKAGRDAKRSRKEIKLTWAHADWRPSIHMNIENGGSILVVLHFQVGRRHLHVVTVRLANQ
jgi:hypothetical protein